jgi:hypothetical protein
MSDADSATQEAVLPGPEPAEVKEGLEEVADVELEIKLATRRDAASDDEGSEADEEGFVTGNHLSASIQSFLSSPRLHVKISKVHHGRGLLLPDDHRISVHTNPVPFLQEMKMMQNLLQQQGHSPRNLCPFRDAVLLAKLEASPGSRKAK